MALSTLFLVLLVALAAFYQLYLNRIGARPTIGGKGVRRPEQDAIVASLCGVGAHFPAHQDYLVLATRRSRA